MKITDIDKKWKNLRIKRITSGYGPVNMAFDEGSSILSVMALRFERTRLALRVAYTGEGEYRAVKLTRTVFLAVVASQSRLQL
jgi:hypothetical protein